MWYNHGKAEQLFRKEWAVKLKYYREHGMTDAQIQELYELERAIFHSDRRFYEHHASDYEVSFSMQYPEDTETYDESNWITVLPQELQERLLLLPKERLLAFYYHRVLHYTQHEIAVQFNKSQVTIHDWIRQIAEIIEKYKNNL